MSSNNRLRKDLYLQTISSIIVPVIGIFNVMFGFALLEPVDLALYMTILATGGLVSAVLNPQLSNLLIYVLYNDKASNKELLQIILLEQLVGIVIAALSVIAVLVLVSVDQLLLLVLMFSYWAFTSTVWSLTHSLSFLNKDRVIIFWNVVLPLARLVCYMLVAVTSRGTTDIVTFMMIIHIPDIIRILHYYAVLAKNDFSGDANVRRFIRHKSLLVESYLKGLIRDLQTNSEMWFFNTFPDKYYIDINSFSIAKRLEGSLKSPLESFNVILTKVTGFSASKQKILHIHLFIAFILCISIYFGWNCLPLILEYLPSKEYLNRYSDFTKYRGVILIQIMFIPVWNYLRVLGKARIQLITQSLILFGYLGFYLTNSYDFEIGLIWLIYYLMFILLICFLYVRRLPT